MSSEHRQGRQRNLHTKRTWHRHAFQRACLRSHRQWRYLSPSDLTENENLSPHLVEAGIIGARDGKQRAKRQRQQEEEPHRASKGREPMKFQRLRKTELATTHTLARSIPTHITSRTHLLEVSIIGARDGKQRAQRQRQQQEEPHRV